jgi:putative peptidoglycan lipid II flippase
VSDVSVEPLDEADTPEDAAAATAPVGRRLMRDNLSVAAGTALSRVTGVARILALGFAVKTSLADAYLLANNTPNIIYELILGGVLTATLVPMFTGHLEDGDEEATNAVVSTTVVALVVLTLVTAAAAPLLIAMYGTNTGEGVDADVFRSVGIRLSLLFAPQVLGYGLMAVGSALLNSRKRFFAAAWAPVLNNVIVTAMFVVVGVMFGSRGVDYADGNAGLMLLLGLGTTAGIFAMTASLWPALRRAGVRLRFRPDFRHPSVRKALTLSGWTIGYVIANQVAAAVVNLLAEPGSGGVRDYQFAFMFFQLPHGLLAVSIMTTFQPDMARAAARDDPAMFNGRLLVGLQLLAMLVVPAAIGYLVLPGTLSAANAGASDPPLGTFGGIPDVLSGFGLGLIGFSAYLFILRGFYAHKDTRTPFLLNLVENAINIVLAIVLVGRFGVWGLAWSYAIAYSVAAVLSLGVLIHRVPGFDVGALARSLARIAVAALAMGLVVWLAMQAVIGDDAERFWAGGVVGVILGVVVYGGLVLVSGVPSDLGLTSRFSRGRHARR